MAYFPTNDNFDFLPPLFPLVLPLPEPKKARSQPRVSDQQLKILREAVSKSASRDIADRTLAVEMAREVLEQVSPRSATKCLDVYALFIKVIRNCPQNNFPQEHVARFLDCVIVVEKISAKPLESMRVLLDFFCLAVQGRCESYGTDASFAVGSSLVHLQNGLKDSPNGFHFFATLLKHPFFNQLPITLQGVLKASPVLMTENSLVKQVVDKFFITPTA